MASKNDKVKSKKISEINKKYELISAKMDDVYQNTYSSRIANNIELDQISTDIFDTVDKVLSTNTDISGTPNVAKLYSRINRNNNTGSSNIKDSDMNSIVEIFSDKQVLDNININSEINRYVRSLDIQYDLICKYMPKLEEALDIKKDNVLSSDSFFKEFLNVSKSNNIDHELFVNRDKELKKKYNLDELIERIYKKTSKYGEFFLYCVPCKQALEQLLKNKQNNTNKFYNTPNISSRLETTVLCENGNFLESSNDELHDIYESVSKYISKDLNINISFDNSGLLSETVLSYQRAEYTKSEISSKFKSIHETFLSEASDNKNIKLDRIMSDELDYETDFKSASSQDGFSNVSTKNDSFTLDEMPGCILKEIERDKIIPLYIEEICMGYLNIECKNKVMDFNNLSNVTDNTFSSEKLSTDEDQNNNILKYISSKVANAIDANFINTNKELKDDIYSMLKYNEGFNLNGGNDVNVTFLPPEDVFHIYFELDQKTHRGISDLSKALIPAMFWCLLDLSTTMGIVTRSQDKRIYYVKQNVEKNTSRTLMNVVNQVKKGNMGIRQIDTMGNMLNTIGRYNDHVIPTNSAGDAPITFEIMQGQQIDTPTDLMNKWEESAINSTDVPLELVNSVMNIDYAIRYTMQNSKFLRKVFRRQFKCENIFTKIYTRVYNYEYGTTESQIKVTLPAPMFLSMTNGAQLINNTREYVEGIANMEYPEETPEKKEFIRLCMRNMLPSYLDIPLIENMKSKASINISIDTKEEEQDT